MPEPAPVAVAPAELVVEAPVAKAPRRVSSTSSEPVLERVTVTPHSGASTASAAEGEAAKPTRKGWWQRKLGLE